MQAARTSSGCAFAPLVPPAIAQFLRAPTPVGWLQWANDNIDLLLLDHANCEKKAASTAVAALFRYPQHDTLVNRMSRLAREELRHFEQVNALLRERGVQHARIEASRYAGRLRELVARNEPQRLRDTLICGAFIEARSCERFAALIPQLDAQLARFYTSLLKSECRHFENYLELAAQLVGENIDDRVAEFALVEEAAILEPDTRFSFHSGPPDGLPGSV